MAGFAVGKGVELTVLTMDAFVTLAAHSRSAGVAGFGPGVTTTHPGNLFNNPLAGSRTCGGLSGQLISAETSRLACKIGHSSTVPNPVSEIQLATAFFCTATSQPLNRIN